MTRKQMKLCTTAHATCMSNMWTWLILAMYHWNITPLATLHMYNVPAAGVIAPPLATLASALYTRTLYAGTQRPTELVQRVLLHSIDDDLLLVVGPLWRLELHHLAPSLQDLHWQFAVSPLVHTTSAGWSTGCLTQG